MSEKKLINKVCEKIIMHMHKHNMSNIKEIYSSESFVWIVFHEEISGYIISFLEENGFSISAIRQDGNDICISCRMPVLFREEE